MFPLQSVLVPGGVLALHVFEARYRVLVRRCLEGDGEFGVVLIERGSEVGGDDVRSTVGTRARILRAEPSPDGRWHLVAVGTERLRVDRWLDDDPHPWATVDPWPDDPSPDDVTLDLVAVGEQIARIDGLRWQLGDESRRAVVEVDAGSDSLASHRLAALAPIGDLDRQTLLAAPTAAERLRRLSGLLDDEEALCRLRLQAG